MSGVHHANQIFRRFLDRISDCAIFVLSRDGRVQSWNDGARAIIGYEPDAIVGQPLSTLYETPVVEGDDVVAQALAISQATGRFETEAWQIRNDGTRFCAAITITAILDDEEKIAGYGTMIRDLTERLKVEEQKAGVLALLEKTAGTDFLTGIANRRGLDAYLITSMAQAKRGGRPLSIAMLDLDHFKAFNDSNGHQAGDLYLKSVSGFWQSVLRAESLMARYGGEEFTVVMPATTLAEAAEAMQRLRESTPPPVTCSIGIVEWDMVESLDALMERADRGLYTAKRAGRNRIEAGPNTAVIDRRAVSLQQPTGQWLGSTLLKPSERDARDAAGSDFVGGLDASGQATA